MVCYVHMMNFKFEFKKNNNTYCIYYGKVACLDRSIFSLLFILLFLLNNLSYHES